MPRRNLTNEQKNAADGFVSQLQSAPSLESRIDELLLLNSYISSVSQDDVVGAAADEALKQSAFPTNDNGELNYEAIRNFFIALGRNAVNSEIEYIRQIANNPETIKGDGYSKVTEHANFIANAKAWVEDDEIVSKFNAGVEDYNKKVKQSYKKVSPITAEEIQKWYEEGRNYNIGRLKGESKELYNKSKAIQENALKTLGITEDELKSEQQKAHESYAAERDKQVRERYADLSKQAEAKAPVGDQKKGLSADNTTTQKVFGDNKPKAEPKEEPKAEPMAKRELTRTEKMLAVFSITAKKISAHRLTENSAKKYAMAQIDKIKELEDTMRDSKKEGHVDSKEYFEPLMKASADVRGIGVRNISLEEAIGKYDNLIEKCDRYINKNSWGIFNFMKSTEGNERLRCARELKAQALEMKKSFTEHKRLDILNGKINEFATKDFKSMDQNQIKDFLAEYSTLEGAVLNSGKEISQRTSFALDSIKEADDTFSNYMMQMYRGNSSKVKTTDIINKTALNRGKTMEDFVREERGIVVTNSKNLQNKLNPAGKQSKEHVQRKHKVNADELNNNAHNKDVVPKNPVIMGNN